MPVIDYEESDVIEVDEMRQRIEDYRPKITYGQENRIEDFSDEIKECKEESGPPHRFKPVAGDESAWAMAAATRPSAPSLLRKFNPLNARTQSLDHGPATTNNNTQPKSGIVAPKIRSPKAWHKNTLQIAVNDAKPATKMLPTTKPSVVTTSTTNTVTTTRVAMVRSSSQRKSRLPSTVTPRPSRRNSSVTSIVSVNNRMSKNNNNKIVVTNLRNNGNNNSKTDSIQEKANGKQVKTQKEYNSKLNNEKPHMDSGKTEPPAFSVIKEAKAEVTDLTSTANYVDGAALDSVAAEKGGSQSRRGTDSDEHVSQTVHIARKSGTSDARTEVILANSQFRRDNRDCQRDFAVKRLSSLSYNDLPSTSCAYDHSQCAFVTATYTLEPAAGLKPSGVRDTKKSTTELCKNSETVKKIYSAHDSASSTITTTKPTPTVITRAKSQHQQQGGVEKGPSSSLRPPPEDDAKIRRKTLLFLDESHRKATSGDAQMTLSAFNSTLALSCDHVPSVMTESVSSNGVGLPKFPRGGTPSPTQPPPPSTTMSRQPTSKVVNHTSASSKLADKLSKSFFDLTQGSHDRLQKWKSKLQQQYSVQFGKTSNASSNASSSGCSSSASAASAASAASPREQRNRRMYTIGGAVPVPTSKMESVLIDWAPKNSNTWAWRKRENHPADTHAATLERSGGTGYRSDNEADYIDYRRGARGGGGYATDAECRVAPSRAVAATLRQRIIAQEPRPLHSTQSASNALNCRIQRQPHESAETTLRKRNVTCVKSAPHSSNLSTTFDGRTEKSSNVSTNTLTVTADIRTGAANNSGSTMEHRTLRQQNRDYYVNRTFDDGEKLTSARLRATKSLFPSIDGVPLSSAKENGMLNGDDEEQKLPPPARILPYSGIKPQDNAIIRPIAIAFRPVNGQRGANAAHRQSIGVELAHYYNSQSNGSGSSISPPKSPRKAQLQQSSASTLTEQHRQILKDHSRSIGNLASTSSGSGISSASAQRPLTGGGCASALKALKHSGSTASTSYIYGAQAVNTSHQIPQPQSARLVHHRSMEYPVSTSTKNGRNAGSTTIDTSAENDYDTVPDYATERKCFGGGDTSNATVATTSFDYSSNSGVLPSAYYGRGAGIVRQTSSVFGQTGSGSGSGNALNSVAMTNSRHTTISSSSVASSTGSGGLNIYSPAESGNKMKSITAAIGRQHSQPINGSERSVDSHTGNGNLHITPSPSDSGIVDYESLIRDKENELSSVRHAMEQNEEVLIRVYQDKERQFREQIGDLQQKVEAGRDAEAALRQQLRHSDEIRQQLQSSVQLLTEERTLQQRKCHQMESELMALKLRCGELERNVRRTATQAQLCDNCCKNSTNNSVYENSQQGGQAPVPAPRSSVAVKESDGRELRSQVDDLRGEISHLRDQLNSQIHLFAEERRRWESDRSGGNSVNSTTSTSHSTPNKSSTMIGGNSGLSNGVSSASTEFSAGNNGHHQYRGAQKSLYSLRNGGGTTVLSSDRLI